MKRLKFVFQFSDSANYEAHYMTTGPEIWSQTDGEVKALLMGVGTGGTIVGIGKYLKKKNPDIMVYCFSYFLPYWSGLEDDFDVDISDRSNRAIWIFSVVWLCRGTPLYSRWRTNHECQRPIFSYIRNRYGLHSEHFGPVDFDDANSNHIGRSDANGETTRDRRRHFGRNRVGGKCRCSYQSRHITIVLSEKKL